MSVRRRRRRNRIEKISHKIRLRSVIEGIIHRFFNQFLLEWFISIWSSLSPIEWKGPTLTTVSSLIMISDCSSSLGVTRGDGMRGGNNWSCKKRGIIPDYSFIHFDRIESVGECREVRGSKLIGNCGRREELYHQSYWLTPLSDKEDFTVAGTFSSSEASWKYWALPKKCLFVEH